MKFTLKALLLLCVTSSARAFVAPATIALPFRSSSQLFLYESVEAAIADAQRICDANPASDECRVAWDIVEELEAANSHKTPSTNGAAGGATMDGAAMMGSFHILLTKIDGKMDQLVATADQFQHVDPDTMNELGMAAQQMKQAIANARTKWDTQ